MLLLRRWLAALFLIGLAALGVAERAALHAHPLDENDLVPHQLAVVQPGGACTGDPHLDAASVSDHPVCAECVLVASAVSPEPSTIARLPDADERSLPVATAAGLAASTRSREAGARGPPRA